MSPLVEVVPVALCGATLVLAAIGVGGPYDGNSFLNEFTSGSYLDAAIVALVAAVLAAIFVVGGTMKRKRVLLTVGAALQVVVGICSLIAFSLYVSKFSWSFSSSPKGYGFVAEVLTFLASIATVGALICRLCKSEDDLPEPENPKTAENANAGSPNIV